MINKTTNTQHAIFLRIIKLIERGYLSNIWSAEQWDVLLHSSMAKQQSFQETIENHAKIGIKNSRNFFKYIMHLFAKFESEWFVNYDSSQKYFMKKYLGVVCYLSHMELASKEKGSTKIRIEPEYVQVIQLIAKNHWFFDGLTEYAVFEMLSLPFLYNTFMDLLKNDNTTSLSQRLITKFDLEHFNNTEYPLSTAFQWFTKPDLKKLLFPIINLCYLLKMLYFNTGRHILFGYYQRLFDRQTANLLYSIPYKNSMYLYLGNSAIYAGSNNIDSIEIIENNTLLLSFKHGQFFNESSNSRAALNIALAIDEYFANYLIHHYYYLKHLKIYCPLFTPKIFLESPSDNPHFSLDVLEQLCFLNSDYGKRITIIPSIREAPAFEQERYISNLHSIPSKELKKSIVEHIKIVEHEPESFMPERAFEHVKIVTIKAKEHLVKEKDHSLFVYIPLTEGLKGHSKREYHFHPKPWTFIGHIGVIQDSPRSATIIATKTVDCVMIPATIYMTYWYFNYNNKELQKLIDDTTMNNN